MATYATTVGEYCPAGKRLGDDEPHGSDADDPTPPKKEGWELVGVAAADGILFWTWKKA